MRFAKQGVTKERIMEGKALALFAKAVISGKASFGVGVKTGTTAVITAKGAATTVGLVRQKAVFW